MKKVKWWRWWTIHLLEKGETANPNWRPKKGIALVNDQLLKAGFPPAKKADIEANYMQMLQLPEEQLKKMMTAQEQPMIIRILAKNMLGGKWFDIIEKMLDRGIGKAKEHIQADVESDISKEGLTAIKKLLALKNGSKTTPDSPRG